MVERLVSERAVSKYLRVHAEPEAALVREVVRSYRHVLAVPANDEQPTLLDGLTDAASRARGDVLCIVVVNGNDEQPRDAHERNRRCLEALTKRATRLATGAWFGTLDAMDLLVIDRASAARRIPRRQGVGLARKIGCDLAVALMQAGKLSGRWIHTSDADVNLPPDYFTAADEAESAAVLTYRFEHGEASDARLDRAHALYEVFLRYYLLGLAHAGSPYACHTIGSTLAVEASAYAGVRGFPRREAAEDFYLVNKLLKLGSARVPASEPIRIQPRRSQRVPFGTGRATGDMLDRQLEEGERYTVYHPDVFVLLKAWLAALEDRAAGGEDALEGALRRVDDSELAERLRTSVEALELRAGVDKALAGARLTDRRRRAHEWFDAFRTRKLVHALRDGVDGGSGLGVLPWRRALAEAPFVAESYDGPRAAMRALAAREPRWVTGPCPER